MPSKERRTFLSKNKDKIIIAIISAVIGALLPDLILRPVIGWYRSEKALRDNVRLLYKEISSNEDIFIRNSNSFKADPSRLPNEMADLNFDLEYKVRITSALKYSSQCFLEEHFSKNNELAGLIRQLRETPDPLQRDNALEKYLQKYQEMNSFYIHDSSCALFVLRKTFSWIIEEERRGDNGACSPEALKKIVDKCSVSEVNTSKWLYQKLRREGYLPYF